MITKRIAQVFISLMGLAFCKVGVEALISPQAVLSTVDISLDTISALSSMRAVYGGMHLVFGIFCFWGIFKNVQAPLLLVALYTAGFVIGRVSGIILDGSPNSFVTTWLFTEAFSLLVSVALLFLLQKKGEQKLATSL
ncbi:MAG: DUF4345 domain-containing protein [Cyclobacteriaceae bacterium]|jgi:hypothetical protein|nr:DUF4345 domain-containing protein [Cyclobacteriaceae bacterium]